MSLESVIMLAMVFIGTVFAIGNFILYLLERKDKNKK